MKSIGETQKHERALYTIVDEQTRIPNPFPDLSDEMWNFYVEAVRRDAERTKQLRANRGDSFAETCVVDVAAWAKQLAEFYHP